LWEVGGHVGRLGGDVDDDGVDRAGARADASGEDTMEEAAVVLLQVQAVADGVQVVAQRILGGRVGGGGLLLESIYALANAFEDCFGLGVERRRGVFEPVFAEAVDEGFELGFGEAEFVEANVLRDDNAEGGVGGGFGGKFRWRSLRGSEGSGEERSGEKRGAEKGKIHRAAKWSCVEEAVCAW